MKKVKDIIDIKIAERHFPKVLTHPYFLEKDVTFCGEHTDKYSGEEYKTLIFQIDGTSQGISISCVVNDDNRKILNGYDFPYLTESQRCVDDIQYISNLTHYRGAKPSYDWVEKLSKKYGLDEDFVKFCGNIEPIYKKLTNSNIVVSPIAEFFLKQYNGAEKIILDSLNEDEKETYLFNLCNLNATSYTLSQKILELSQEFSKKKDNWNVVGSKDIQADRLYVIKHIHDTDGGFGDAIRQEDILFTTLDKNMADAYLSKYSKPVVYDRPYNDLYHGELRIDTIPFIHTMDIAKAGPELFGGVNTLNEKDVRELENNSMDELDEEEL